MSYVCGNRFLITNSHSVGVSVTYRVAGTDEEAGALLSAAPAQDPEYSERLIETRNKGSVELLLNGTTIAVRDNGGVPCTPTTPAPSFSRSADRSRPASGPHHSIGRWWPSIKHSCRMAKSLLGSCGPAAGVGPCNRNLYSGR